MPGAFDAWSRRPVEWDPSAALRSPHEWCSLSGWLPADALVRGHQAGPREPNRVWAVGLYRLPEQHEEKGRHKRPRPPSPLVLVLPEAWRELCRAVGMVGAKPSALAVALARADLCVPQRGSATLSVTLPQARGSHSRFYAIRGEITALCIDPGADPVEQELAALRRQQLAEQLALPPGGLAVAEFLAELARPYLMGWYAMNPPAVLVPRPGFALDPTRSKGDGRRKRKRKPAKPAAKPAGPSTLPLF